MKKIITSLFLLLVPFFSYCQSWTNNGLKIYYNSGNVGIGTNSPTMKLDVRGSLKLLTNGASRATGHFYASGTGEAGIYFDASNGDGVGSDYGSLLQKDDLSVHLNNYGANPIHLRTAGTDRLTVLGNGNVGVGTTSPSYKLHVNGSTFTHGLNSSTAIHIYSPQAGNTSKRVTINTLVGNNAYIYNYDEVAQTFHSINFGGSHSLNSGITVHGNGNVSIGAANMGEKLEVNGTIRSKKVKVDANGWPDYVFASDYKLRSLVELEAFIKDNHHLPEVPSAAAIEKEGLDLGDMDATLMKKVEELTLYMIEMKKEIEVLRKENKKLSKEVKEVKK